MRRVWIVVPHGEATAPSEAFTSQQAAEAARWLKGIPGAYEVRGVPLVTQRRPKPAQEVAP